MIDISTTTDKYVWLNHIEKIENEGINFQLCQYIADKYKFKYFMNQPCALIKGERDQITSSYGHRSITAKSMKFSLNGEFEYFLDKNQKTIAPYAVYYKPSIPIYEKVCPITFQTILLDKLEYTKEEILFRFGSLE